MIETPSAPTEASEKLSVGRSILSALKGEHHDYTTAPLNRAVLLLAVPMVLEMLMESLFAIADVYWVSRLGKVAIAVVGLTESVMTLVYAIAIGLSIAATAVVARRIGEKDPARASEAAGQVILLGLAFSSVIGVVLAFLSKDILGWMGADHELIERGTRFARIMLGGNATVFMIYLINAIFRGAGDAVLAMRTLWLANALNIVLGPCFIFGLGPFPRLGIVGAAVATNIGRGTGVLYQLWHLSAKHGRISVHLPNLRPNFEVIRVILRPAWNGMFQLLINMTSWLGLFRILSLFGDSALAGYTVAVRVIVFALMPAWGLASAGATLVGQNLGAQRPDRAEAAVIIARRFNMVFLAVVGLIFVIFAPFIIHNFSEDPEVLHYGISALRITACGFPLYAAGMCYQAAFNGAGDTWTPTRLNFFCLWLGQIPLAWTLAKPLGLGPTGVFIAIPVAFSAFAASSAWLFKRGKWKAKVV